MEPHVTDQQHSIKFAAVAGQDIDAGIRSPVITVDTPIDVSTVFWQELEDSIQVNHGLQITVEDGMMTSLTHPNTWMKQVQLSRNCQVQNLQIAYDSKGNLFLQTIHKIAKSEPLYAWFSMETSKTFNIPFLTLKNIQGDQQYRCHHCDVIYQNPNPLKVHLAFFCSVSNIAEIHNRHQLPTYPLPAFPSIFQSIASYSSSSPYSAFRLTTPRNPDLVSETDSIRIQSFDPRSRYRLEPVPLPEIRTPLSFVPFGHEFNFAPTLLTQPPQTLFDSLRPACVLDTSRIPATSSKTFVYESLSFTQKVTSSSESSSTYNNDQVTLGDSHSSDLTTSDCSRLKRRHKCYYCGKMYSRKYGLKIHIRTHTGYKPLKCKVCLRPFGDPSNLNKHVRLHAEGITPYRCDLCGKVLVRRRDLERHLKSRHPSETRVKSKTEKGNNNLQTKATTDNGQDHQEQ